MNVHELDACACALHFLLHVCADFLPVHLTISTCTHTVFLSRTHIYHYSRNIAVLCSEEFIVPHNGFIKLQGYNNTNITIMTYM